MLMWKEQGGQELWDCMDDLKLLETLGSDYTVEDEDEVDWEGLIEEWERYATCGDRHAVTEVDVC